MSTPLPICYLDGSFIPLADARVSPLDRAFLFGDAVYEVIPVYGSRPFRLREHLDRLNRSLEGIRMGSPLSHAAWSAVCAELVSRNAAAEAHIYLQVTRGTEPARNHAWNDATRPTLFAYATQLDPIKPELLSQGVAAITAQDTRWARRDIKSTALLANVLLKRLAVDAGAFETILLEGGELTEGSSTTVHVIKHGSMFMVPNGTHILPGTTRDVITELTARLAIANVIAPITEMQLRTADEIWLSFSTRGILPVTRLDAAAVGDGIPGPLFHRVHAAFLDYTGDLASTPVL